MSFSVQIKEEITHKEPTYIESLCILSSFIRYSATIEDNKITLNIENPQVARFIYKLVKQSFKASPKIIYRQQKKLRAKTIYILEINNNIKTILDTLNIMKDNKRIIPESYFLQSSEERIAYLKGLFLSCGSLTDPKISGYHLEFVIKDKKEADHLLEIFEYFKMECKMLKRSNKYMLYIKNSENISSLLKLFETNQALFYYEDIRIYRDHKNMVNRLNNCEIANQEKVIKTGLIQLELIEYLKEHDLIILLDEKIRLVLEYRTKYPEVSYAELSYIIEQETGTIIGKSGINHYFIKIKKIIERHKKINQD